jgi:hypothetical protein
MAYLYDFVWVFGEALATVQLALDEGPVDSQFRGFVRNPRRLPSLDLLFHRLEIPLNQVDSGKQDAHETEALAVLCKHRSEHA